jgi:hypothetical protein
MLTLVGWNVTVLEGLQDRLRARDIRVETSTLADAAKRKLGCPLVLLAERRPLEADVVTELRAFLAQQKNVRLANMLTPEIDIAIRDEFAAYVQTADGSACMQDVFVEWLLQEGAA